jgi:predicted nucleic acid-binding protein
MFVLDNSVAVAWFIEDEADETVDGVLDRLQAGDEAIVPGLWAAEFLNALGNAVRHGRLSAEQLQASIEAVSDLPIRLDAEPASVARLGELRRRQGLSPYDLCYLELAMRLRLPLATKDAALAKAAGEQGVALLL